MPRHAGIIAKKAPVAKGFNQATGRILHFSKVQVQVQVGFMCIGYIVGNFLEEGGGEKNSGHFSLGGSFDQDTYTQTLLGLRL